MTDRAMTPAPLSDFIEIKHGFAFQSEFFTEDGDYLLLTPGNFIEEGGFRFLGVAQKRYSGPITSEYVLNKGDVLVAMTEQSPGLLGATLKVPVANRYLHNQRLGLIRIKRPDQVYGGYIYHFFNAPHVRKEVSVMASGTKVKHTSPNKLCSVLVSLPSLDEQLAIATLLDDWDVAIDRTLQLISARETAFFALIDRLVFDCTKSEFNCRHVTIREIADRIQRKSDGGDYPLLTISSASGFISQEERYSRYMAGESAKTYTLLRRGEFAYNKGNSLRYEFGCIFQLMDYDEALVPSIYVSFRLHDSVCGAYMRHLFAADYLKPQLRGLVKTGVRNNGLLNIRPDEFMGATVPLPPLKEQERIAAVLDEAQREIELLTKSLSALRQQKRGLMQKLLTGEWRVPAQTAEAA